VAPVDPVATPVIRVPPVNGPGPCGGTGGATQGSTSMTGGGGGGGHVSSGGGAVVDQQLIEPRQQCGASDA